MKHLARERTGTDSRATRQIHLVHTTIEPDQEVFEWLARDAPLAQVRLHLMVDARDGLLTGARLRSALHEWRTAGIWLCRAAGVAHALQRDVPRTGVPVAHQSTTGLYPIRPEEIWRGEEGV